jgi:hypothetical protein
VQVAGSGRIRLSTRVAAVAVRLRAFGKVGNRSVHALPISANRRVKHRGHRNEQQLFRPRENNRCLSPGKACSHFIEALLHTHLGHLHHLTHVPVQFRNGDFRLGGRPQL